MMKVFERYSTYYNFLYQDKNYVEETNYINALIHKYLPHAKSILDLGCGTGKHAKVFAVNGYSVCGVDISKEMFLEANKLSDGNKLKFYHGDIRKIRLNATFDVITSLFHVMNYQTNNDDLESVFKTIKVHLKPKGIFIFDSWYGPGVLSDKPFIRVKRFENKIFKITRISQPVMLPNKNIVDVKYCLSIYNKKNKKVEKINETHKMRYLFNPEIVYLLKKVGLKLVKCEEWMSGKRPTLKTWYVCFICKNIK